MCSRWFNWMLTLSLGLSNEAYAWILCPAELPAVSCSPITSRGSEGEGDHTECADIALDDTSRDIWLTQASKDLDLT
jgi:hypothetical protein